MTKHKGVYNAFKVIYEMQKAYELKKEYQEDSGDDDGTV